MTDKTRLNLAIFVSGSGTNCENLIRYFSNSDTVRTALVVSNKPDAYALVRAESLGVPTVVVPKHQLNDHAVLLPLMERYEHELESIEKSILRAEADETESLARLNEIRGDILDLRTHYEQLLDLGQELEENENSFFKEENVRYFRLFVNKIQRLQDSSAALRDYTVQLRDLYQSQLDVKQNRIMTVLTVVTTIFMPLTLIVGWYGMNFRYMPELNTKWGYPAVIVVSVLIVIGSLIYFKKKKWL